MSTKYLSTITLALSLLISGCGSKFNPIDPPVAHAATPSPSPTPSATPTPTPIPFPPAQPLTCSGSITAGGQQCDQSDGVSFYRHDQFSVSIRADGHGTFQIISEVGISSFTGLHQITFQSPATMNLVELHGTASIDSWCNNNGVATTWDSTDVGTTADHLIGGKNFLFKTGDTVSYVIPQVLFPQPVPFTSISQNVFTDLCGTSTVHWVLNGSF